jgi:hypothetical protein
MTIKAHAVVAVVGVVVAVAVVAAQKVARRIRNHLTMPKPVTMRNRPSMETATVTRLETVHIVDVVAGHDAVLVMRLSLVKMIRRTRLCAFVSHAVAPQKPVPSRVPLVSKPRSSVVVKAARQDDVAHQSLPRPSS